jgi:hypothetical protein
MLAVRREQVKVLTQVKPQYHETDGSRIKVWLYIIYAIQEAFTAFIYFQLLITSTLAPKNVTLLGYFMCESWKAHYLCEDVYF